MFSLRCSIFVVHLDALTLGVFCAEPNNDSPLNVHAAELWLNQELYKKVLLEKYQRDTKQSPSSTAM